MRKRRDSGLDGCDRCLGMSGSRWQLTAPQTERRGFEGEDGAEIVGRAAEVQRLQMQAEDERGVSATLLLSGCVL